MSIIARGLSGIRFSHSGHSDTGLPKQVRPGGPVKRRKTLVLDLDETLIHTSVFCINPSYDLQIELYIDKQVCSEHTCKFEAAAVLWL